MPVRLPAEWETHECVFLAWPHEHTDWAYMLDEARECIASIVRAVSVHECVLLVGPASLCRESVMACGFDPSRVRFVDLPTNDTWARDFGPITVETGSGLSVIDFKFNAWGMKFAADKDNLINTRLAMQGIFKAGYVNRLGFVLEGGSIESDGCGTLLTTAECLLSPNRNGEMTEGDIRSYLADTLGFSHQLWLHHGALAGDDTDSHIDTLARLAPHDTIIYIGSVDSHGQKVDTLAAMRDELLTLLTRDAGRSTSWSFRCPTPYMTRTECSCRPLMPIILYRTVRSISPSMPSRPMTCWPSRLSKSFIPIMTSCPSTAARS